MKGKDEKDRQGRGKLTRRGFLYCRRIGPDGLSAGWSLWRGKTGHLDQLKGIDRTPDGRVRIGALTPSRNWPPAA